MGALAAKDELHYIAAYTGDLIIGSGRNMADSTFWTDLIDDVRIHRKAGRRDFTTCTSQGGKGWQYGLPALWLVTVQSPWINPSRGARNRRATRRFVSPSARLRLRFGLHHKSCNVNHEPLCHKRLQTRVSGWWSDAICFASSVKHYIEKGRSRKDAIGVFHVSVLTLPHTGI